MRKILNILITFIMFIIYLPLAPIAIASVARRARRATREHKKIINIPLMTHFSLMYTIAGADHYKEGEYEIYLLRDYSLCAVGGACIIQASKSVLVGYELVEEFERNSPIGRTFLLHEQGHLEAPNGLTTKKLWWNPEDWLNQSKMAQASTLGELAADRWALENGGDGEALIKFLKHNLWISPIAVLLRIHHIRRYMKEQQV